MPLPTSLWDYSCGLKQKTKQEEYRRKKNVQLKRYKKQLGRKRKNNAQLRSRILGFLNVNQLPVCMSTNVSYTFNAFSVSNVHNICEIIFGWSRRETKKHTNEIRTKTSETKQYYYNRVYSHYGGNIQRLLGQKDLEQKTVCTAHRNV